MDRRRQVSGGDRRRTNWLQVAGLLVMLLCSRAPPATAHDWYPWECCSGLDCAPVIAAEVLPEALLRVTTIIPASFERRHSRDAQMHACMRPSEGGGMQPICLFVPPGT